MYFFSSFIYKIGSKSVAVIFFTPFGPIVCQKHHHNQLQVRSYIQITFLRKIYISPDGTPGAFDLRASLKSFAALGFQGNALLDPVICFDVAVPWSSYCSKKSFLFNNYEAKSDKPF